MSCLLKIHRTCVGNVFNCRFVNISELEEKFFDLSKRFDGNIFDLSIQELVSNFLLLMLLFG